MNTQRSTLSIECPTALGLTLALFAANVQAGELNVTGHLNVASNLTAQAVTLAGETRTNWPSGGGASGATGLTTAVLDFSQTAQMFRFTLTNNTTWVFTNHVAGREVTLRLAQNATGGWTNTWPSDLLWPDGNVAHPSLTANHFNLFKIADDGTNWLALAQGLNYRIPCVTNCNYALQFDGSQNYAEATASASYYPTNFTIEGWVKDLGSSDGAGFFGATAGNNGDGWYFHFANGGNANVAFRWNDGGQQLSIDSYHNFSFDTNWHHIAVTYDGTSTVPTLWVDGVSVGSGDTLTWVGSLTTPSSQTLDMSCVGFYGNRAVCVLDEVRISRMVRYSSTFTPAHSFTVDSDTVAYYKFNEGTGTTAHDETSNHDASLSGSPTPTWMDEN